MYPQSEGDYNYNQLAESSYKLEQELRNEIEMLKDRLRLLQQTPCTTLREELHTIANRLLYSYPSLMEEVACKEVDKKIEAINLVMELIDAQQPVA